MRLPKQTLPLLYLLLPCLLFPVTVLRADTTVKRLAPGVTLTQEIDQKTPLVINVVTADLSAPGVRVGVGIGQDKVSGTDATQGREDVSRLARRWGALAAVNADFFPYTGDPLGVGIRDGELFSEPYVGVTGKGGPRVTLGVAPGGRGILFDTLGFLGDLQTRGGERAFINGIDRSVGRNEIVVFTGLYGPTTANKPGGVEAVITGVNLPVRADKLLSGRVASVRVVRDATESIPQGGVVISGGPGAGAEFLARNLHPGEPVSFVLAVAPAGETRAAFGVALLPRTRGDLPSRAGESISRGAWTWAQVPQAVGGGPRLLTDGQVMIDWAAEGFDAGFAADPNPRTAAGVTRDGHHLLLVTVDGRQGISRGVSLAGMALILKRYGAWDAINLDGGGSTEMAVGGLTVSSPGGEGAERPVADMLLVYSDQAFQPDAPALPAAKGQAGEVGLPALSLVAPIVPLVVGRAIPLRLSDGSRVVSGSSPDVVWRGPAGGVGFVNQKGYLITQAAGRGVVSALYHGRLLTAPVTVLGAAPRPPVYALRARLAPDPVGSARRSQVLVRLVDPSGRPRVGVTVHLSVSGGRADRDVLTTDADGSALGGISWTADRGGAVQLSSGDSLPITLLQP